MRSRRCQRAALAEGGCRLGPDPQAGEACLLGRLALGLQHLQDHRTQLVHRHANQLCHQPGCDHVLTPALHRLGQLPDRAFDQRAVGLAHRARRRAGLGVADHQPAGRHRHRADEAVGVLPVDGHQDVEFLGHAGRGGGAEPDQRRRLATANLRADRAGEQAVPSGLARRFQQQRTCGDRPGAAGADDGEGDVSRTSWDFGHGTSRSCAGAGSRRGLLWRVGIGC